MLNANEGQKEGQCDWSRVRRGREAGDEAREITGGQVMWRLAIRGEDLG